MLSDKAPYVVTIIVAALAWTITHIVDRLLTSSLVSYQQEFISNAGKQELYLTLKNITPDKTFHDVHLILAAAPGFLITEAVVIPIQPAWEGDQPGTLAGRTFDDIFPRYAAGSSA